MLDLEPHTSEFALVGVDITEHDHPPTGGACPADATRRYVHVVLPAPLGSRTLVDATSFTPIAMA